MYAIIVMVESVADLELISGLFFHGKLRDTAAA